MATAGTWWVVDRDQRERANVPPARSSAVVQEQGAREQRLGVLLRELAGRLGRGDVSELASPAAVRALSTAGDNVRKIGFRALTLRYVAPGTSPGQQLEQPGSDTWVADVEVGWQFRQYDAAPSKVDIPFLISDDGKVARFGGVARVQAEKRVPLWLLEDLAVRKGPRTLVLSAVPGRTDALARLATRAVADVHRVLPSWRGSLVLEAPSSKDLLDRAIGSDPTGTRQLAGVTTTVDGTLERGAATHVFLNPSVFDRLGPRAAQIVVSHEATHVATQGAVSAMPQWLSEGFADFVALRDSDLPVSVAAGQILGRVRRDGPPGNLPTEDDFAAGNPALGATYESSWLACRLIAERYGQTKLVAFYRRADRDGGTTAAFRTALGTTERAFTRSWSSYLARLASTP